MGNLFTDIKTAVRLTGEVRSARKQGVKVTTCYRVPLLKTGYWGWTMEGCLLDGPKWRAAIAAFDALPEATRYALTFTPQRPGEWVERAQLYRDLWRPALPPRPGRRQTPRPPHIGRRSWRCWQRWARTRRPPWRTSWRRRVLPSSSRAGGIEITRAGGHTPALACSF